MRFSSPARKIEPARPISGPPPIESASSCRVLPPAAGNSAFCGSCAARTRSWIPLGTCATGSSAGASAPPSSPPQPAIARARAQAAAVAARSTAGMLGADRLGERGPVQRAERPFDGGRDARERRRVALGEARGLGGAQPLDEVEEAGGVVALEGDDELLVVEAEGVRRVEIDVGVLLPHLDVLLHDLPALVGRERIPLAGLDERV